jgi:hypothetical protein
MTRIEVKEDEVKDILRSLDTIAMGWDQTI